MGIITAKQLKLRTGEVLSKVRSGEQLIVTYRGKPVAVIAPPKTEDHKPFREIRPFDEAWRDIEESLQKTEPQFKGWREATAWIRNRV